MTTPDPERAFLALSAAEHHAAAAFDALAAIPSLHLDAAERDALIRASVATETLHRSLDARRRARVVELHGPPGPPVGGPL